MSQRLPTGWDLPIPDENWPDALIEAVSRDPAALGSPRAVDTLRTWRAVAHGPDPERAARARAHLAALAAALQAPPPVAAPTPAPSLEAASDDFTVDTFQLPPKPRLRREALDAGPPPPPDPPPVRGARRASLVPVDEGDTDARVLAVRSAQRSATGASAPPESSFGEEDDKPTTAFAAPQPAPDFEEDDKPTRHIPLPEEVLMKRLESAEHALEQQVPERTEMSPFPPRASQPMAAAAPGGVAPKPGVIRRSRASALETPPRPRAAMHHVRTLYGLIHPLSTELAPLPYERRARRFWARWREVAGDRGVRRGFVEALLRQAEDARTLTCELIAEAQSVDVDSVYTLVDKIGQDG